MGSKLLTPLSTQVPIVDKDGKPSPQFCRVLQELAISSNLQVTSDGLDFADFANHMILARKTTGTGAPEQCTVSEILDFLGTITQGSILYKGASGWTFLPPGTSGDVLQTNGVGANPAWATPSGGGGGGGTPTIRSTNFSVANSASITVTLPTGTVVGDVVICFTQTGWAPNNPTGWTVLDATPSGGSTVSKTFGKEMTSADITAGSVTITFTSAYWAGVYLVTINGTTMTGVRDIRAANGLSVTSSLPASTDRVIAAVLNRQVNTPVTVGSCTALMTYNVAGNDHSAFVGYYTGTIGKFGVALTASPTGHYFVLLALK